MADDLQDVLKKNASGPASAEVDGQRVAQHKLKDQIEADRYMKSSEAVAKGHRGLRISKLVPPGSV
jgi:hypothetical protein